MRKLFHALAMATALPLAAAAQDAAFDEAALYEKAQEEGELTWYVGQYTTEVAEEVGARFTEKYPGVEVNVIRASGSVVYSRLQQDLQAGVGQCDVFSATDPGHAAQLKKDGQLQPFTTASEEFLYPQFQDFEPEGYYALTMSQPIVLFYNTTLLTEEEAPKSWTELVDPKWRDKLAFGHPAYSGSMGSLVSAWILAFGEDYIQQLADLNAQIGRSLSDPVASVGLGERSVGTGTLPVILGAIAAGNPLKIIIPEEGALVSDFPSAIPVNAPHPNAARLFVNYLQSAEFQEWSAKDHFHIPINVNAEVPEGLPGPSELKALDVSPDDIAAGVLDAIEVWRDAFGA